MKKQCNFNAVKSKGPGGWTASYQDTLEKAQNWVSPCDHYIIYDVRDLNNTVVIEKSNWNVETNSPIWIEPETQIEEKVVELHG